MEFCVIALLYCVMVACVYGQPPSAISGTYPDPADGPVNFSTHVQPYYTLTSTPIFNRVVSARLYHKGVWVFSDDDTVTQTPSTIGSALAKLKPTFIHGLLVKQAGANFSDQEVASYIAVRKAVLAASPYCKFSIILDAKDFLTLNAKSLINLMLMYKDRARFYPDFVIDAVHFEHWNQAYANQSSVGDYVIQYLHSMNLLVGGNTYGGSIPRYTDYIGMTTESLKIVPNYEFTYPAIGLISNSNPLDLSSDACAFMNSTYFVPASDSFNRLYSGSDRISLLEDLAAAEDVAGFSLAWPVFAPVCPSQHGYDSTADGVYDWILSSGLNGVVNLSPYVIHQNESFSITPHARNISRTPDPLEAAAVYHKTGHMFLLPVLILGLNIFGI